MMRTKFKLKSLLAVSVWAFSWAFAQSQPCLVDSQYLNQGIYPSDTLPDMQAGVSYDEVVQMVLPPDTVVFGFTLTYDSVILYGITGIPTSINWACNASQNFCHYVGNGIDPFRLCFRLTGTPIDTTLGLPGWDSIMVSLSYYVTTPFGVQAFNEDRPLYYRKGQTVSLEPGLGDPLGLQLSPNPMGNDGWARFVLEEAAAVDIQATDAFGRRVWEMPTQFLQAGSQKVRLGVAELPAGVYFLHLMVAGSATAVTRMIRLE